MRSERTWARASAALLAGLSACSPVVEPPAGAAFVKVEIAEPAEGAVFGPGKTLLRGRALDTRAMPEEPLAHLVWKSDRDGELGRGARIEAHLASPGPHTLTLRAETPAGDFNTATVAVAVFSIPAVRVARPRPGALALPGAAVEARCRAFSRASGAELLGGALRWFVDGVAEAVASGPAASLTLAAGAHRIVCRADDAASGLAAEDGSQVSVGAPVVRIHAPREGATVFAGRPVTLSAEVADTEPVTSVQLEWLDSRGTALAEGLDATTTFAAPGEVRLRAVYRRLGGDSASAEVTVPVARADAPPTVALQRPAANPTTVGEGTDVDLLAAASDPEGKPLRVAWWDSMAGRLGEGPSARLSAAQAGKHVVTVRATDVTGQTASDTRVVYAMPAGGAPLLESAAGGALDVVAVSGRHLYYAKAGATAVSRLDPDADEEPLVLEAGAPVRALAPAPIGAVVATADGYAVCGEDGCARHRGTGPGRLPSGATTAVLFVAASAERPARLFVGTEAGLFIAADAGGSSEGRTCFVPGGDGDYAVADLAWDDARGAVWIAARERGAFRADPAAAQCALEPAGALDGVSVSAAASRGGEAWFGTAEGLYRLGDADFADPRRWGAASARVNDIALSPSGIVWLATAGGACRWDPLTRAGACLVEPSELPNGDVHALAMRGEEKWLATPAGLHRWRGR